MTHIIDTEEQIGLDEAVRRFKAYCQGDGSFDELDFKEWIIDTYVLQQE